MMGAGKSSVGRALSQITGREFRDTDQLLENRLGRTIPQIFQVYGESAFRDHETAVLRSLEPDGSILATGGGIVLRDENWDELRRLGITIYLSATIDSLKLRLEKSKRKRPLLESDDWEERLEAILSRRTELYQRAEITISADDGDTQGVAERVLDAIRGLA